MPWQKYPCPDTRTPTLLDLPHGNHPCMWGELRGQNAHKHDRHGRFQFESLHLSKIEKQSTPTPRTSHVPYVTSGVRTCVPSVLTRKLPVCSKETRYPTPRSSSNDPTECLPLLHYFCFVRSLERTTFSTPTFYLDYPMIAEGPSPASFGPLASSTPQSQEVEPLTPAFQTTHPQDVSHVPIGILDPSP
eukprot:768388-Hanusia_phi.AAC.4